jgi:hypothetical protein
LIPLRAEFATVIGQKSLLFLLSFFTCKSDQELKTTVIEMFTVGVNYSNLVILKEIKMKYTVKVCLHENSGTLYEIPC